MKFGSSENERPKSGCDFGCGKSVSNILLQSRLPASDDNFFSLVMPCISLHSTGFELNFPISHRVASRSGRFIFRLSNVSDWLMRATSEMPPQQRPPSHFPTEAHQNKFTESDSDTDSISGIDMRPFASQIAIPLTVSHALQFHVNALNIRITFAQIRFI